MRTILFSPRPKATPPAKSEQGPATFLGTGYLPPCGHLLAILRRRRADVSTVTLSLGQSTDF
jgi:hypothetical protein